MPITPTYAGVYPSQSASQRPVKRSVIKVQPEIPVPTRGIGGQIERAKVINFQDVVDILDKAVGGRKKPVGKPHGAFWRNTTLDKFIEMKIEGLPLIDLGFPVTSNLVSALRGRAPFGKDLGVTGARFPRMPKGHDPVPEGSIRDIEEWIEDRCQR